MLWGQRSFLLRTRLTFSVRVHPKVLGKKNHPSMFLQPSPCSMGEQSCEKRNWLVLSGRCVSIDLSNVCGMFLVRKRLKVQRVYLALYLFQIADFGLSNLYHGDEYLQTFCGSPLYASPEIVNGRPYRGPEVDTWSLGVLLYTMVHGTMPFDGNNHKSLVQQISTGNYRKPNKPSGECFIISLQGE